MKKIENLEKFKILNKGMQEVIGGRKVTYVGDDTHCFKVVTKNNGEFIKMKSKEKYHGRC